MNINGTGSRYRRRVFRVLCFFSVILLFSAWSSVSAQATTYYVSTSGSNGNPGTNASPWETIGHACSQVVAGDTVVIKSGYQGNDEAEVANTGTSTAPIIIRAETPGTVVLTGDGGGSGIYVENKSFITIEGIRFVNYSFGVNIKYDSTNITVRNCVFFENNSAGIWLYGTKSNPANSHSHLFTQNEFYDYDDKQDYGIALYFSTNVKAVNNYFYGWHHQALSFKKLMFNSLAANNIFEGYQYSALYLGQNLNGPEGDLRCHELIAEGNVFRPANNFRAKTSIWIANVERAVVRNNFMEGHDSADGGWGQGIAIGDSLAGWDHAVPNDVTIYNNVIREIGGTTTNPGIRVIHECGDIRVFNNTIADCAYGLGFESYETLLFKNNIFFNSEHGMIRGGDSADAQNSVFEYNDIYPDWTDKGITDVSFDPLFVGPFVTLGLLDDNPSFTPDFSRAEVFRLQQGSPCIDAGVALTHTVGSGTGNEVHVDDAGYFTDGFGVAEGDFIGIGGDLAGITGIDYSNNVIFLDSSISWSNGDGVSLAYSGAAPDLGAYEEEGPDISPPTIQSVTASGDPQRVVVVFSEPLDQASATNAGHFTIDNGITVASASIAADGLAVTLTTSALSDVVTYTLTVNDVEDLANNVIDPSSQMTFIYTTEQSGLVGHWKLDEESGTEAADSSGNGNDGVLHGGAIWTAGKIDGGLELNGVDGYVEIRTGEIGSELTLVAWLNTSVGIRQTILERWLYDSGVDERSFVLDVEEDGNINFSLSGDGMSISWLVTSQPIPSATWTHVAAVSDGNTMRIYINGSPDSNTASAPTTIHSSAGDVHIGRWWAENQWFYPYGGIIDDVRIYNRALTPEELGELANGCPAGYQDCNGDPADGCEVDVTSDVDNCGACGNQCDAEEVCSNGQCKTECDPGLENCGGSCVDLATNPSNCGACDNACDPGQECVNGSCNEGNERNLPGGCGCQAGGGKEGGAVLLAMVLLLLYFRRRQSMMGVSTSRRQHWLQRLATMAVVSLAVIICSSPALAADYYVSGSGDNNGAGSVNDPWETISFAINNLQPGDSVNVEGGQTYQITSSIEFDVSGAPGSPITLRSYNGRAVIRAEYNINILKLIGNYLVVEDITLEHGGHLLMFHRDVHDIVIRDVEAYDAQGSSVFLSDGVHNIVVDGCDFHSIHETSHGCGNLIEVRGEENALIRDVTFRNSQIHDNPCHAGFNFFAVCGQGDAELEMRRIDNFLIENCEIYNISGPMGTNCCRVNNLTVRNCEIRDCYQGIKLNADDSLFEGNTFRNIPSYPFFITWTDADSHNLIIRNNYIEDSPGEYGIVIRDCHGAVVTNTTTSNTAGHVLFYGKAPSENIVQDHESGTRVRIVFEGAGDGMTVRFTDGRDFDVLVISGSAVVGPLSPPGPVRERIITVTSSATIEIQHDGSVLACTGECCSAGSTCGAGGAFVDSADCGMLCCIGVCDGPDLTPPTIQSVTASAPDTVLVVFSEPLHQASATDPSHYAIDNGVTVSNAALEVNGLAVTLTTSTLTEDVIYTLTVNNVQDLATNVIEPSSQMTFQYSIAPSGLVGHWKLDEESGTEAADSSGNGNDGVLHGGAIWTAGRIDGGLELNGVDGYVEIRTGEIGSELTLVAWLNTSVGIRQTILERWLYDSGVDERSFVLDVEEDGNIRFGLSGDGMSTAWVVTSQPIPSATWTHVAAVSDGNTMRIYINGSPDSNTASAPASIYSSAGDVHIGRWWAENQWFYPYGGIIDDVRIYNRALTPEELGELANGCPAGYQDCNGDPADGCEVDVTSDVDNCGACGNQCDAGQVCSNGQCQAECDPGLESCGGSCVDLATNTSHCGACENACDMGAACIDGSCDNGSEEEGLPGGCGCRSGTGHEDLWGFLRILALLILVWGLRRYSNVTTQ